MDWKRKLGGQRGQREVSPHPQNTNISCGFFRKEFRPDRSQYSDRSGSNYNEDSTNYQVAGVKERRGEGRFYLRHCPKLLKVIRVEVVGI